MEGNIHSINHYLDTTPLPPLDTIFIQSFTGIITDPEPTPNNPAIPDPSHGDVPRHQPQESLQDLSDDVPPTVKPNNGQDTHQAPLSPPSNTSRASSDLTATSRTSRKNLKKVISAKQVHWKDIPNWGDRKDVPLLRLSEELLKECLAVEHGLLAVDYLALAGSCSLFRTMLNNSFFKTVLESEFPEYTNVIIKIDQKPKHQVRSNRKAAETLVVHSLPSSPLLLHDLDKKIIGIVLGRKDGESPLTVGNECKIRYNRAEIMKRIIKATQSGQSNALKRTGIEQESQAGQKDATPKKRSRVKKDRQAESGPQEWAGEGLSNDHWRVQTVMAVHSDRINKTAAMKEYKLCESHLITLRHVVLVSAKKSHAPEQLFFRAAVRALALRVHNGVEGFETRMAKSSARSTACKARWARTKQDRLGVATPEIGGQDAPLPDV